MTVVDVHTHMLTLDWIDLLQRARRPRYEVKQTKAGQNSIWKDGAPFMTLMPGMWDYDLRIKAMDKAKVDRRDRVAHLSELLLRRARDEPEGRADRQRLDGGTAARAARPHPLVRVDRRGSMPDDAKAELARCVKAGAVGVMQLANVVGEELTRREVCAGVGRDRPARLPVLIHPRHAAGHEGHEPRRIRPGAADRLHDRHDARRSRA